MRRTLLIGLILSACAKEKEPPANAQAAAAQAIAAQVAAAQKAAGANGAAPAIPGMPPGVPNAAQLQQAMMQAGVGQQKTAVNWRSLMPLLSDDLAGWKAKGDATGETTTAGAISVSKVERRYEKDGKEARVEIFDTAVMPALASSFQMLRMSSVDASDHYSRGIDLGGNPGWEDWRKNGSGEVTGLIGGRFLLKAGASGLTDAKPLVELVGKVDIPSLAALNK